MKKLTLLAVLGIALGLIYLAVKQAPEKVSAPKIKSSDALSANLRFIKEQEKATRANYQPRQMVAKRMYQPYVKKQTRPTMVNRRAVRKPTKIAMLRKEQSAHKRAESKAITKKVVVQNGDVKIPRASDGKWVDHLSGENVDLEVHRGDLSSPDCTQTICPDKPESYTLLGVVVNPRRVARRNIPMLDGSVAKGDGQQQPFVYIK